MNNRVVITGMGAITPVGNTVEEFWHSLCNGISGVDRITDFDVSDYPTQIAACVKDFNPDDHIDKKQAKRMDRYTQFAVAAGYMAIKDAGLNLDKIDKERLGIVLGTGIGGIGTLEEQFEVIMQKGPGRVSPFLVPMMIANMAAGQTSIQFGFQGPCLCVVTACTGGTNAIGEATRKIQHGDADMMLAGGTEAAISQAAVAGFCSMKAMSTRNDEPEKASRPFQADRDGFVMGEGAGIMLLESLDHALARGANIYGEVVGYGANADAYHISAPRPGGEMVKDCMERALEDAQILPDQVNYINTHGTSTPAGDVNEVVGIKMLFGDHAKNIAVGSTKSMTGHLLGAAGGIEAIACTLAVYNDEVPPTINCDNPEEGLDLDFIPNVGRKQTVNVALSNSFGFGGHNGTVIVQKYKP